MEYNLPYVLVAEDDADDRYLLESAFKENLFPEPIIFVENGVKLLTTLQSIHASDKLHPKLIIMDLNMPKKDGREVLKELKADENLKQIPVIIFSTTSNKHEMDQCYALGADSYILKPDSFSNFLAVVVEIHRKWLTGKSQTVN